MPETLLSTVGLMLCAVGAALHLPHLYLIAVHLQRGRRELARERQQVDRLARALASAPKPLVCVQLPLYNEAGHVAAAIDCLCALNWPRDRLEIMVLDDSTDQTSAIAAERTARWLAAGVQIRHLQRDNRREFKAGALQHGLESTQAEYIAVFDADYRPAPSFLSEMVSVLAAAPRAAFVQARLDYRNRDQNALTRAQALQLDSYSAWEHAARTWAGVPTTFNGTCGVWRREAILDAGGWSGRSLAEDQDLSLRAFAREWTCRNLVSISVPGELPASFQVLSVQRQRWGTGTAQTLRDLPWRLLRHIAAVPSAIYVLSVLFHAAFPVLVPVVAALAAGALIGGAPRAPALAAAFALLLVIHGLFISIGAALAARLLGRPLNGRFVRELVSVWALELALALAVANATVAGLFSREIAFARTPKVGH